MQWIGYIVRMKDERLLKRSETKKQEGCRKRGKPQLGWEDCVERSEKGRGGRKVERKCQQGAMENYAPHCNGGIVKKCERQSFYFSCG